MTSTVAQSAYHEPVIPPDGTNRGWDQVQLAANTTAGNTLALFSTISSFVGTLPQTARNAGQGSPAATGDPVNGTYTQADLLNDTGNEAWASYYVQNASSVSSSQKFTVNYTATDDFYGCAVAEIAGVTTSSLAGHHAAVQTTSGSGTDNVSSGTAALGSSPVLILGLCTLDFNVSTTPAVNSFTSLGTGWGSKGWGLGRDVSRMAYKNSANPGTAAALFSSLAADTFGTLMMAFTDSGSPPPPTGLSPLFYTRKRVPFFY